MKNGLPPVWLEQPLRPSAPSSGLAADAGGDERGRLGSAQAAEVDRLERRPRAAGRRAGVPAGRARRRPGRCRSRPRAAAIRRRGAGRWRSSSMRRGRRPSAGPRGRAAAAAAVGGVQQQPDDRLEELVAERSRSLPARDRGRTRPDGPSSGTRLASASRAGRRQPRPPRSGPDGAPRSAAAPRRTAGTAHALLVGCARTGRRRRRACTAAANRATRRVLPMPGSPVHDHQAALVARGLLPARLQPPQRGGAADERSLLGRARTPGSGTLPSRRGEGTHRATAGGAATDLRTVRVRSSPRRPVPRRDCAAPVLPLISMRDARYRANALPTDRSFA